MDLDTDVTTAAYQRLTQHPEFLQLLRDGVVGTDALLSEPLIGVLVSQSWVFQGLNDEGAPYRDPEGSGRVVIVVSALSEWSGMNAHNTAKFPRLQVLVYADATRDDLGAVPHNDARQKAAHVVSRMDKIFHLPQNQEEDQRWGELRIHSSLRQGTISVRDVPKTQSQTVRAEITYQLISD